MNSFFERKQEYFDMIYQNPEVIQSILSDGKNKNNPKIRVFFNPNTENELLFVNSYFKLFMDIYHMTNAYSYEVSEPDLEHNSFLNYINKIIFALQHRDIAQLEKIKEELHKNDSIEQSASLGYDMMRAFLYDSNAAINFLCKDNSQDQFELYFQHANAILNSYLNSPSDSLEIDFENTELINSFHRYVQIFDSFYRKDFEDTMENVYRY